MYLDAMQPCSSGISVGYVWLVLDQPVIQPVAMLWGNAIQQVRPRWKGTFATV